MAGVTRRAGDTSPSRKRVRMDGGWQAVAVLFNSIW